MSQDSRMDQPEPAPDIDEQVREQLAQEMGGKTMEQLLEESAAPVAPPPAPAEGSQGAHEEGGGAEPAPAPADGHPDNREREQHQQIDFELKRGRIAAIHDENVFVDLTGMEGKNQGVVPLIQFERPPRVGSIMDFVVERFDEAEGLVILSREGAVTKATWQHLQRGALVEARCVAVNKGGLELEMVGGIRAFMPASQVDFHHVDDMAPFIGQKLRGMVQEIDRKSKKVVLSRRKVLEHEREQQREKIWESLKVGDVHEGTVRSIVDFGAFVELGGGVDGLVHVSDMSYSRVEKPAEVVKVGEKVTVKVLRLDKEHNRISLGLKQVAPDPWQGVADRVKQGDQVSGRVLRLTTFGAFIEIEPGIEGLLPLAEMSWKRIGRASDVVHEGDVVKVAVLHVDGEKKRVGLSLKQVQGDPWAGATIKYAARSLVEGTVMRLTDFGAFVELETGIEGLVHISELADRRVGAVADVLKVGDRVQFRVLETDIEQRRIRLSLKQVKEAAPVEPSAQKSQPVAPAKQPAKRKHDKALKGGMEHKSLGTGLGDLRL